MPFLDCRIPTREDGRVGIHEAWNDSTACEGSVLGPIQVIEVQKLSRAREREILGCKSKGETQKRIKKTNHQRDEQGE